MADNEMISDLAEAVLNLRRAMVKHGFAGPTAINVSRDDGMRLRAMPRDYNLTNHATVTREVRKHPSFCVTICGVDFDMDRS